VAINGRSDIYVVHSSILTNMQSICGHI